MMKEDKLNETTERFSRRLGEKPGLGDGSCFEGHISMHTSWTKYTIEIIGVILFIYFLYRLFT